MAYRKLKIDSLRGTKATIAYNSEYEEYRVRIAGYSADADYFTNDRDDAISTAKSMLRDDERRKAHPRFDDTHFQAARILLEMPRQFCECNAGVKMWHDSAFAGVNSDSMTAGQVLEVLLEHKLSYIRGLRDRKGEQA